MALHLSLQFATNMLVPIFKEDINIRESLHLLEAIRELSSSLWFQKKRRRRKADNSLSDVADHLYRRMGIERDWPT